MPLFDSYTPETIKASILNKIGTDLQTREGSYTYDLVSPVAFEIWRWCMTLDELIHAFYVDETSGIYLDKHANLLGLARKAGTKAHAEIYFQGKDGLVIPAGTVFLTPSGLQYSLVYDVTFQNGEGTGCLQAAEVGDQYNAAAGEINQIVRTITGLDAWTTGAAMGGTDPESDADLFSRIDNQRKNPGTSGNEAHYLQWALECDGVGAAKVTGLWAGPGTVRVLLVGYDREPVDQDVVDAAAAYIETVRPVGADVTVLSAEPTPITVTAKVVIDTTTTLEQVKTAFVSELDTYLRELAFEQYIVYRTRVGALLMGVPGVVDIAELQINGKEANLILTDTTVPVSGEVTLT